MQGTLKVGVLVAIASDLDDPILILWGKCFLAVINGNEAETDETLLEAEGKVNGGKSVLFNLKDTAILYSLLNSLWPTFYFFFFYIFKLNELWPYYQKYVNQIILNRITL